MIFITAKFQVKPEHADRWPQLAGPFTEAMIGEALASRELMDQMRQMGEVTGG